MTSRKRTVRHKHISLKGKWQLSSVKVKNLFMKRVVTVSSLGPKERILAVFLFTYLLFSEDKNITRTKGEKQTKDLKR